MTPEEVVEKIRKCIRLANRGATEGERHAARERARALAEKNGIAIEDLDEDAPIPVRVEDEAYHTRTGIEQNLATKLIDRHFGVASVWSMLGSGTRRQRILWFGERCNIPVARQIYVVATRAARRAWEDRRKKDREAAKAHRNARRRWRRTFPFEAYPGRPPRYATTGPDARKRFMIGFFAAIDMTLEARPLRNDLDRLTAERNAALARIDEMQRLGRVVDVKTNTGRRNRDAEVGGFNEGRKVSLNRPVSDAARATPLLENAKEAADA